MILEGSIHRFGLASVLQFLAQNAATGVLEVRDSEENGFVYLVDGNVEGISLPITDDLLGARLVKTGCLTQTQLREALIEDAALTPGERRLKPLGERLVDKGLISETNVRKVMQRQVLDQVFELSQWRTGTFIYDEPPVMPAFRVKIQGNVQGLLTYVQRRIDQNTQAEEATAHTAGNAVCRACPVEHECSDGIKAKYLKADVCLWRNMSTVLDHQTAKPDGSEGADAKASLDSSTCSPRRR